jgi:hypothetical protein
LEVSRGASQLANGFFGGLFCRLASDKKLSGKGFYTKRMHLITANDLLPKSNCPKPSCPIWRGTIALWQAHGYQVKLWFLSLPNEDIAVSRVAHRVQQGGHNIPEDVIRRRFKSGLANFHDRYRKAVDLWVLFDNYGIKPKLIDWSDK